MTSESSLYNLAQDYRRLARADVHEALDGHRLAGEIRQEYEHAYQQLSDMLDQLLDGHQLNDLQERFIAACRFGLADHHTLVQQLRRAWA